VRLPPAPRGTETILVVDDDSAVLVFCVMTLQMHGYRLLTATSGTSAIRICESQKGNDIHLAIIDVIMPDMNGIELAKQLGNIRPLMKPLLITGHSAQELEQAIKKEDVSSHRLLFKPFESRTLAFAVRNVLDAPTPRRKRARIQVETFLE
jgi:two-component system cell cycle sensor histidine kinase/response regulator CckA